eukprot:9079881-Alexandrium_andersonii.AAC.1
MPPRRRSRSPRNAPVGQGRGIREARAPGQALVEIGFEIEGRVVAEAVAAASRGFAQQMGRPRAAGPEHLRVLSL